MAVFLKHILVTLSFIQLGHSLRCYHCVDNPGSVCDEPEKNENFIKECNATAGEVVCYFRNTTLLEGSGQIVRDCASINECDAITHSSDVNTTCSTCKTDLCNKSAGSSVIPSFLIMSVVYAIILNIPF